MTDHLTSYISSTAEESIKRLKLDHDNRRREKKRSRILEWLSPFDYEHLQRDFSSRRQEGTGEWFLQSEEFSEWVQQPKASLFCPGIPGAGKTILTTLVVDELPKIFNPGDRVAIAYIFCSYQPKQKQRPEELLASILKQLLKWQLQLPSAVTDLHRKCKSGAIQASMDDITIALRFIIGLFSRIFIVVDGLDEYHATGHGQLREFLSELFLLQAHGPINLFVTSRPIHEIASHFTSAIIKEIRASDHDLSLYIDAVMPKLLRSSISEHGSHLQKSVKETLVKAADGMFLLVRLHLEALMGFPTVGDLKKALRHLPVEIAEVYEQAMRRIDAQEDPSRRLARNLLAWLTYAKRNLRPVEVQHALAIDPNSDMAELDTDYIPSLSVLTSLCAGLVVVDHENDTIRLAHYTTQEFFERGSMLQKEKYIIAASCINYLCLDVFDDGPCHTWETFEARLSLHPLYDYASRNWAKHVSDVPEKDLEHQLLRFVESDRKTTSSWQASQLYHVQGQSHRSSYYSDTLNYYYTTGLHLAAYFNLHSTAKALLQTTCIAERRDSDGRTPLSIAVEHGFSAVVRILLAQKPDLESKDTLYNTPLVLAAREGHTKIAELLLGHGADPNSQNIHGETGLRFATAREHTKIVKMLLENGADPNIGNGYNAKTAVVYAIERNNTEVVQNLLDKGADLNIRARGITPIISAILEQCNVELIELLLKNGADPNVLTEPDGATALMYAVRDDEVKMVETLLGYGADPNMFIPRLGQTAVQLAMSREPCNLKMVEILLNNPADPNPT